MNIFLGSMILAIALSLGGGLIRVLRGPTHPDQMIAAQLLGTLGVGLLLLPAELDQVPALRDVALVLATLAAVVTLAFVRLHAKKEEHP